ncbi:Sulfite reductase [NADPH] hemoprotein beta-component [bacterium HR30]|nr:Sulfite reductase [NADPH] hemoprotein beta-component [bacterium HR30]
MRTRQQMREQALEAHASRIERYQRGELSDDEFRPIRLSYGLYYQLDHTSHMQRIKLPAGVLTAEQAEAIADIAEDYARGVLHVTTRQDIQLHWVALENVVPMYRRLHAVGISTRGACADSIRNITGCFHSGLLKDEPFDIVPYVFALNEYFLFHPLNITLPRKFKISFSSCAYDCVQGPVNDIAFYPRVQEGRPGFLVLAGGGLGAQPFLAKRVAEFVPAEDLLAIAEAIVRVQHRLGERKNRKKARMKYVVQRIGVENFRREIADTYSRVQSALGEQLRAELADLLAAYPQRKPYHPPAEPPRRAEGEFARWLRTNVFVQKQGGYFGVTVQLPLGDLTSDQMRRLAALSREHGAGELRTSNDQNLFLPWIPGDRLEKVWRSLVEIELGAPDALHITDVVSCPGADYCSLAVSRSMGMAEVLRQELAGAGSLIDELGVFRIRISGCPNACGQHHVGDIGLTGMSLQDADGQHRPYYSMLVGARLGEDDAMVGKRVAGRFPAAEVPNVVRVIADLYRRERLQAEGFADFVARVGVEKINEVARSAAPGVR